MGSPMNFIDAHIHVWTDDLAHYPLAPGHRREDMSPRSFTPEEFLRHARPAGVNRAVLIQMSYYHPSPGAARPGRRDGDVSSGNVDGFDNRYMLDMIQMHKGVFVGTAVIDPHAKDVTR